MNKNDELHTPNFSPEAFVGTARYYSDYRLPYPNALLQQLRLHARITGRGCLVDLGCGQGRLTLPLAPFFDSVVAVDAEKEMIEEGQKRAHALGTTNVRWHVAAAESFRIAEKTVELVTVGEAFHRFDQHLIAASVRRWLKPECCFALVGQKHPWHGDETWHEAIRQTMARWTPVGGSSNEQVQRPYPFEQILAEEGFIDVERKECVIRHVWTIEELIGFFYSTSVLAKRVLGTSSSDFEADLKARLLAVDQRGEYPEDVVFEYVIGRAK